MFVIALFSKGHFAKNLLLRVCALLHDLSQMHIHWEALHQEGSLILLIFILVRHCESEHLSHELGEVLLQLQEACLVLIALKRDQNLLFALMSIFFAGFHVCDQLLFIKLLSFFVTLRIACGRLETEVFQDSALSQIMVIITTKLNSKKLLDQRLDFGKREFVGLYFFFFRSNFHFIF